MPRKKTGRAKTVGGLERVRFGKGNDRIIAARDAAYKGVATPSDSRDYTCADATFETAAAAYRSRSGETV